MDRSGRPRTGHDQVPQLAAVPLRLGSDAVSGQRPRAEPEPEPHLRTRGLPGGHDGRPCGPDGGPYRARRARARRVGPAEAGAPIPAVQVQNQRGGRGRCGAAGETCEGEGKLDWRPDPDQTIAILDGAYRGREHSNTHNDPPTHSTLYNDPLSLY